MPGRALAEFVCAAVAHTAGTACTGTRHLACQPGLPPGAARTEGSNVGHAMVASNCRAGLARTWLGGGGGGGGGGGKRCCRVNPVDAGPGDQVVGDAVQCQAAGGGIGYIDADSVNRPSLGHTGVVQTRLDIWRADLDSKARAGARAAVRGGEASRAARHPVDPKDLLWDGRCTHGWNMP
jgi:hypothetical protein